MRSNAAEMRRDLAGIEAMSRLAASFPELPSRMLVEAECSFRLYPRDSSSTPERSALITRGGGVLLVIVGLLQVTGLWSQGIAAMQVLVLGWQAPL